jgi:hypothetical protein
MCILTSRFLFLFKDDYWLHMFIFSKHASLLFFFFANNVNLNTSEEEKDA